METIPKPDELLALHSVTEELFDTLRAWFDVPDRVTFDLTDIDAAVTELGDPLMIAATAMRKLQALRLLATPGVRTSTDVVVTIVQDLNRALLQAPAMRLKVAASEADWDAELAAMLADGPNSDLGGSEPSGDPTATDDADDPETARFRELHQRLHEAVYAVLEASDGEIRYLE